MEEKEVEVKKKGFIGSLIWLIKKCLLIFIPGIIIALVLFVIIEAALVPTSSPKFCGELCHQEMAEPYASWQKSTHANNQYGIQVECIDCHLPPKDDFFSHLFAKAQTGIKDVYMHFLGGEYNAEEIREKVREHMTNEVCLRCHGHLKDATANETAAEIHDMMVFNPEEGEKPEKCIECHEDVGHVRE